MTGTHSWRTSTWLTPPCKWRREAAGGESVGVGVWCGEVVCGGEWIFFWCRMNGLNFWLYIKRIIMCWRVRWIESFFLFENSKLKSNRNPLRFLSKMESKNKERLLNFLKKCISIIFHSLKHFLIIFLSEKEKPKRRITRLVNWPTLAIFGRERAKYSAFFPSLVYFYSEKTRHQNGPLFWSLVTPALAPRAHEERAHTYLH